MGQRTLAEVAVETTAQAAPAALTKLFHAPLVAVSPVAIGAATMVVLSKLTNVAPRRAGLVAPMAPMLPKVIAVRETLLVALAVQGRLAVPGQQVYR